MYRASTVPASAFKGAPASMRSTFVSRSTTAAVARGGFGATGRGFAAASSSTSAMSAGS